MRSPVVRLVALLARVLPGRTHRREAARAFEEAYRRRHGEEGPARALVYALRTAVDLVRVGWSERRRTGRRPRRHEPGHDPMGRRPEGSARHRRAAGRREGGGTGRGWTGTKGRWGMAGLGWELRYALRGVRRAPGLTGAAVLILALGIGGNTAIFSALEAVILRPPPYPEPERLAFPAILRVGPGATDTTEMTWSHAKYRLLEAGTGGVFAGVAAYASRTVTLRGRGDPERVGIEIVSPSYFRVLGVDAALGRTFTPAEGGPDPAGVALLAHELWTGRFGADPGVVGEPVELGDVTFTVVGVLPPGFRGLLGGAGAWIPLGDTRALFSPILLDEPQGHWLDAVARLAPGVSLADARARTATLGREVEAAHPLADGDGWAGAGVVSMAEARGNPVARTSVLVLGAAAALVLLIAVLNLAGLLLTRELDRVRESSVRMALGSGRWGLLRSRLVEAGVLVTVGGVLGLLVARLGIDAIVAAWPAEFSRSPDRRIQAVDVSGLGLSASVLLFSLAATVGCGLVFGVLPALAHRRDDLMSGLRQGPTVAGLGRARVRAGRLLVAGQAALAVMLLVAAGLLGGTLLRLEAVDRGFDETRLLSLGVRGVGGGESEPGSWDALARRLGALPDVRAVTAATAPPYSGWSMGSFVSRVEGRAPFPPGERPTARMILVAADYFEVLGARLVAGTSFGPRAAGEAEPVVLNETAAAGIFGDADPLGRVFEMDMIRFDGSDGRYRVVGVVGDILQTGPRDGPEPVVYTDLAGRTSSAMLLVRTRGAPFDALRAVREVIRSLLPGTPVTAITTVEDLGARTVGDTRLLLSLLALFAGLALTLTVTGTYGLVAFGVSRRRRELGLRMALGAHAGRVAAGVLGGGLLAAATGVVPGILVGLAGTRYLSSILFQVDARNPVAFALGAGVLLLATALASWLPARRVTRLDPAAALRTE